MENKGDRGKGAKKSTTGFCWTFCTDLPVSVNNILSAHQTEEHKKKVFITELFWVLKHCFLLYIVAE